MLVFFGTSHHSASFLKQAIQNGLQFDLVVSALPKPTGRKQILTENPTATIAKQHQIPYLTSLAELLKTIKQSNNITIGLILDFNQIIPKEIIDLFKKGIINIHFSKLPQYRGPAPVQATILSGDKLAWISYFLITERFDEGKILTQTSLLLDQKETTQSLYEKLIAKASQEISQVINDYLTDKVRPCQQEGTPSYTHKLTSENTKIDWQKPATEIDRLVRAAYPEPIAWTSVRISPKSLPAGRQGAKIPTEKRLKILKAHLENSNLILDTVQLEGKNPVSWKQFCDGHPGVTVSSIKQLQL